MIKFEIDKFRDYIKGKKEKIRTQKNIVEKMIREEEEEMNKQKEAKFNTDDDKKI